MPRSKPKSLSTKKAPVQVRAIDFVMYNAKDVRKTRAFYQEIFGFKRGHEWNDCWTEFDTEPITFCLNGPAKYHDPAWDWIGTPVHCPRRR